jgi:hypothetical protein
MPPKKRPVPDKGAAARAEPLSKRKQPKRGAAAANGFAPEPPDSETPDSATLAVMFNSLSTRVDEMNTDTAAELANFDENLQANTRRLDDLVVMLQQIQQALPQGTSLGAQGFGSGSYQPGMTQSPVMQPLQLSQDVLSRWHWVSQSTVESIANGSFDIYELPKLHRDQTLRDRYIQKNIEGIIQPLNGGKPQLLHARTKLQNTFNELETLLPAWLIYASIRVAFVPGRGPGLLVWTERLVGYNRLKYNFADILDYFVAYFQKHQNSPPEQWFQADTELHTEHLGNSTQKAFAKNATMGSPNKQSAKPSSSGTDAKIMATQVCHAFNRATGCKVKERSGHECLRRHVCANCDIPGHPAHACSKSSKSSAA